MEEKWKIQVIKFSSNVLFNNGKINYTVMRNWAKELKRYQEETGIWSYIRASGSIITAKYFEHITTLTSELSRDDLVWLAGIGEHKKMNLYEDFFRDIYKVSLVPLTPKAESDPVYANNFIGSVLNDFRRKTIPITNIPDRIDFSEIRGDNDGPGADDALLLNSHPNIEVVRYMMVGADYGIYQNPKDISSLIWRIKGVKNWHKLCCGGASENGLGGPMPKLLAGEKVNHEGIDTIICNVYSGFTDVIAKNAPHTYMHGHAPKHL